MLGDEDEQMIRAIQASLQPIPESKLETIFVPPVRVDEDDRMLQDAIKASINQNPKSTNGTLPVQSQSTAVEEEEEQDYHNDEPSVDELRRRRLARFGG